MKEKIYCIYKHTAPNGKVYIGQTCQIPEQRFGNNGCRYRGCTLFYNAIQKYGWDNIKHEILLEGLTQAEANEKEVKFIHEYNSNDRKYGYNLQSGGNNGSPTLETRRKMAEWQIGKVLSEETKYKISMSKTGRKDAESTKKKKSEGQKGKHLSIETRQKLSVAGKERADVKRRGKELGLSNKGRKHSEESKKHMSEAHKMINAKKVLCVETSVVYSSVSDAEKCTGICRQNIGKVCNGKLKTAGGFHWKYT